MTLREAFEYHLPGPPPPKDTLWLWPGSRFESGYGRLKLRGKSHRAHRVSYELFVGPIPEGLVVRHSNDTPLDVNPNNLELGTELDNSRDRVERGRGTNGEQHHSARLTSELVREMRQLHAEGATYNELGRQYGVSGVSAQRAVDRITWKHIA